MSGVLNHRRSTRNRSRDAFVMVMHQSCRPITGVQLYTNKHVSICELRRKDRQFGFCQLLDGHDPLQQKRCEFTDVDFDSLDTKKYNIHFGHTHTHTHICRDKTNIDLL